MNSTATSLARRQLRRRRLRTTPPMQKLDQPASRRHRPRRPHGRVLSETAAPRTMRGRALQRLLLPFQRTARPLSLPQITSRTLCRRSMRRCLRLRRWKPDRWRTQTTELEACDHARAPVSLGSPIPPTPARASLDRRICATARCSVAAAGRARQVHAPEQIAAPCLLSATAPASAPDVDPVFEAVIPRQMTTPLRRA